SARRLRRCARAAIRIISWCQSRIQPSLTSHQGAEIMKRIVVLGGGFGGVAAAQRLDRQFRHDDDIEIVVVSNTNFLVYTPMLADVAGGTIEPRHAVPPVRAFLKKSHFREAFVKSIDAANHTVHAMLINGDSAELQY